MVLIVELKLCGQVWRGPIEVFAQSKSSMRRCISVPTRELGAGALLGEESLASGTPVPAGVQAKDAVEVYALARPEFLTLTAQGHLR